MRLHLNKTLRAALIAAIATVGFTLSQAQADQQLNITPTAIPTSGGAGNSGFTWTDQGVGDSLTSWRLTFTLKETRNPMLDQPLLGTNGTTSAAGGDFLKVIADGSLTLVPTNNPASLTTASGVVTYNTPVVITLQYVANVDDQGVSLNSGTYSLSVGGGDFITLDVSNDPNTVFYGNSNSSKTRMWTNSKKELFSDISLYKLADKVVEIPAAVWKGEEGTNTWVASNFSPEYKSGDNVKFTADGTHTVVVASDITAGKMTVTGADYTFDIQSDASLSVTGVSVSTGASATLTGSGTYALASGSTSLGDVTLDDGWAGVVRITDASLNGIDLSGMRNAQSTVELKGFNGWTTPWEGTNDYNFKLTNGSNGYAWQNGAFGQNTVTHIMEFSGVWSGDGLFLETGATATRNMHYTYSGNITAWTGEFRHDAKQDTNLTFKGSATDVNIVIGMGASSTGVFNVVAGTEDVTFNKAVTANKLTIDSGASATLKDQADFGTLAAAGTLTVDADTHTVTIGGGSVGSTIDLQAGTLTLTGAYNISDIDPTTQPSYVNGDSPYIASGNGFKHTEGSVHVVSIQAGAVLNAATAEFTYGTEHSTGLDEHGDFTLAGSTNYSTLYVNNNDGVSYSAAWDIAQAQTPAVAITSVVMAADTTLTADKEGASIALSLTGATATVNATAATTISGISGWSHELTIGGTAGVTIAGQTLTGTQKLVVDGIVSTTGALTVNNADASLVVNENATLNINGNANLSPVHGSVQIDGTVNISHELDLSKGKTSNVQLGIGSTGKLTAWGMWMHSASSISLAEEGEFTIGHNAVKDLTIIGKADSGITYLGAAGTDSSYGTNNENYKITNATVNVTGANVTLGNTLSGVDVFVDDGSSLTLNTDADSVTVGNGGTFTLNEGKTVANITVEDGGTIAGGVDASQVGIEAGATATFNEGVTDKDVTFGFFGPAQVTNNGGETAVYGGIGDEDMRVKADALVAGASSAVSVANSVEVESIANYGEGALTLTAVNTQVLEEVDAMTGDISLQNTPAVSLANMTVSTGATVSVYTDEQASTEGTVTITESLVAGGGTLLANLVMEDGSMLDVNGGNAMALTLGSEFNLAEGAIVTLDNDTLAAIANLENIGDTVILVKQYQDHALTTNLVNGDWSRTHFDLSSITDADYKLFVTDTQIGLVKSSNTPEPTTGTLSLLALAALAARRRKHN